MDSPPPTTHPAAADDEDRDVAMAFADEFFDAARAPAMTAHEEWLLRICAQLMHREAAAVRMLEQQASWAGAYAAQPIDPAHQHAPPQAPPPSSSRRSRCRRASRPLDTSTDPSTGTPPGSSSA